MGFNFGQFIGGMSRQISTNIEEAKKFEREKQFRLDMLAEEEATKMRLARASERREQRKRDTENASLLKSIGYTDSQASWILKGGDATVNLYSDWGAKAYAKGISPASILGSNLVNSDQQDPRNEAALNTVLSSAIPRPEIDSTAEAFTVRQDIMTGVLGEPKKPKKVQQLSSTKEGYATALNMQINARMDYGENSQEYTDATEVLEFWQKKMSDEAADEAAAAKEKLKDGELFSPESRGRIIKDGFVIGARNVGEGVSVDLESGIFQSIEGKEAQGIIANFHTAGYLMNRAQPVKGDSEVVDQEMMRVATNLVEVGNSRLDNYSRSLVATTYNKDKAKELAEKGKFNFTGSYLRNNFDKNGDLIIPSMIDILENNPVLGIGDVVIASVGSGESEEFKIFTYINMVTDRYNGMEVKFHEGSTYDPTKQSIIPKYE